MKVGFIGLGLMGQPMAKNILRAGFDLTVYNRTLSKTLPLKKMGAKVAQNPQQLGSLCDVIITMITAGKDVKEVLFGKNGVTKKAKKGLIIIDMGTIGPTYAKKIAKKLAEYDINYLDAPVTGSIPAANDGTLIIFIGGKKAVFEKVKPVLLAMGKILHYVGENGSGQAIKMINNYILAMQLVSLSEAMFYADFLGLSRKKVIEVLQTVPAVSASMKLKLPYYNKNNFPLFFSLANLKKDLTLAYNEIINQKSHFPTLRQIKNLYQKAAKKYGQEDCAAIIKSL